MTYQDRDVQYLEVDELDFRLGLKQLLIENNRYDQQNEQLINLVVEETRRRALKEALLLYQNNAVKMSFDEMISEEHCSARLAKHLEACGYERFGDDLEAHAIVSGNHYRALAAREILADMGIRIDDPANGILLPNFKRNLVNYPNFSYSHRSTHTKKYYLNITSCLEQAMTKLHARAILRRIADGLVSGAFPLQRRLSMREVRSLVADVSQGAEK